jgi:hypothetical protein
MPLGGVNVAMGYVPRSTPGYETAWRPALVIYTIPHRKPSGSGRKVRSCQRCFRSAAERLRAQVGHEEFKGIEVPSVDSEEQRPAYGVRLLTSDSGYAARARWARCRRRSLRAGLSLRCLAGPRRR